MKNLSGKAPGRASLPYEEDAVALDLYPDPALVTGTGWVITGANRLFEVLVDCPPGGLVGRRLTGLFAGTPLIPSPQPRHGRVRRTIDLEVDVIRNYGGTVPVSLSICDLDGSLDYGGAVVTARDITGKVELSARLENTREELARRNSYIDDFRSGVLQMVRELDRSERELEETCGQLRETQAQLMQSSKLTALGELSAGLAHELNQPLTVIKGLVGKILKEKANGATADLLEKLRLIEQAGGRMEEITGHLRVFARSEAQAYEPVDLNRVIKDAFMMMREHLNKHSTEVELDLGPVARVRGCSTRLEQVIINLAANARDAMPEGGRLRVTTRQVAEDDNARVEAIVSDSGAGMDPETAARIFTPFFTTKPAGQGTGLGLSISRNIVKEHGGEIKVESAPGQGTTFILSFPAAE